MAGFRSSQRTTASKHSLGCALEYAALALVVGFFCLVLFMMLFTVTHGWSANP
jgi:hypothetical protein